MTICPSSPLCNLQNVEVLISIDPLEGQAKKTHNQESLEMTLVLVLLHKILQKTSMAWPGVFCVTGDICVSSLPKDLVYINLVEHENNFQTQLHLNRLIVGFF